jgi:hypothetical protein
MFHFFFRSRSSARRFRDVTIQCLPHRPFVCTTKTTAASHHKHYCSHFSSFSSIFPTSRHAMMLYRTLLALTAALLASTTAQAVEPVCNICGAENGATLSNPTGVVPLPQVRSSPAPIAPVTAASSAPTGIASGSSSDNPAISPQPTMQQTMPVNISFEDLRIDYDNVGELSSSDFRQLELVTETWFDEFFQTSASRRELRTGDSSRELQRSMVQNMSTTIAIQNQVVASGINTVYYNQQLTYVAYPGADEPKSYVTLPYRNIIANGDLGRRLRANITAFAAVGFPISIPRFPDDVPTKPPVAAPVVIPTGNPTISPQSTVPPQPSATPRTMTPTQKGEPGPVDVSFEDLRIDYENVGELSSSDFRQLELVTETWFNEFYAPSANRRELGIEDSRELQSSPVQNMSTTIAIQNQVVASGINTIYYNQQLTYVASPGANEPKSYVTLPYRNIIANGDLGRRLRVNITAFAAVGFPISIPRFPDDVPTKPPVAAPLAIPTVPVATPMTPSPTPGVTESPMMEPFQPVSPGTSSTFVPTLLVTALVPLFIFLCA